MTRNMKKKLYIIILGVGLLIGAYAILEFVFPLVWPFVLAYGIAVVLYPIVKFLKVKLHFHKNAATILTLIGALGGFVTIVILLADKLLIQLKGLIQNAPLYEEKILYYVKRMCGVLGRILRMDRDEMYGRICDGFGKTLDNWQGQVMPTIVNNSWQTFMMLVEVIIVIALIIMAVFFMTRDLESIQKVDSGNLFYKEINYMRKLVSKIVRAYIRSQLIIMSCVASICVIVLLIIGNDYYILIGITLGVLDALPLVGVGAVLIPWSVVYVFMGEYVKAAMLFTAFILCYLLREFLEPRLMGQRVGISPIASLVSIYVGYQLFGIIGMIAGPLVYVLIKEVIENYYNLLP